MTTDADTGNQIDAAEVWRAIGRLEGDVAALLEGQREIKSGLEETNRRLDEGLREMNQRLDNGLQEANRRTDRLLYAVLGVGGALLVAIFVSRFIGG
jgi:hypothetical protein